MFQSLYLRWYFLRPQALQNLELAQLAGLHHIRQGMQVLAMNW